MAITSRAMDFWHPRPIDSLTGVSVSTTMAPGVYPQQLDSSLREKTTQGTCPRTARLSGHTLFRQEIEVCARLKVECRRTKREKRDRTHNGNSAE